MMALCTQEQPGCSGAAAPKNQQQCHEGVQTMKGSQQLILSLAKLERAAFPSLTEIMEREVNQAL